MHKYYYSRAISCTDSNNTGMKSTNKHHSIQRQNSVNFIFDSIFVFVIIFINEKVFALTKKYFRFCLFLVFESIIVSVSFLYYRFFNIVLPMLLEDNSVM